MSKRQRELNRVLERVLSPNTEKIEKETTRLKPKIDISDPGSLLLLINGLRKSKDQEKCRHLIAVILENAWSSKVCLPAPDELKVYECLGYMYWTETKTLLESILLEIIMKLLSVKGLDRINQNDSIPWKFLVEIEKKMQSDNMANLKKAVKAFQSTFEFFPNAASELLDQIFCRILSFLQLNVKIDLEVPGALQVVEQLLSFATLISEQLRNRISVNELLIMANSFTQLFVFEKNEPLIQACLSCLSAVIKMADFESGDCSRQISQTAQLGLTLMEGCNEYSDELRIQAMFVLEKIFELHNYDLGITAKSILDAGFLILQEGIKNGHTEKLQIFEIEAFPQNSFIPTAMHLFQQYTQNNKTRAAQVIRHLDRAEEVEDSNHVHRSAYFLLLGLITENCQRLMAETNCFDMKKILKFQSDSNTFVKTCGMFALIQTVRFMKVEMWQSSAKNVILLLVEHLKLIQAGAETDPKNFKPFAMNRVLEALKKCLTLSVMDLHLPPLVDYFLARVKISPQYSPLVNKTALDSLTALATGSKGIFQPFVQNIIQCFRLDYPKFGTPGGNETCGHWIDLMDALNRNSVVDNPIAQELLDLSLKLWHFHDPTFLVKLYRLVSGLTKYSGILTRESLSKVVNHMLEALTDLSDLPIVHAAGKEAYAEVLADFYGIDAEPIDLVVQANDSTDEIERNNDADEMDVDLSSIENSWHEDTLKNETIPPSSDFIKRKIQIIESLQEICMNYQVPYRIYLGRTLKALESLIYHESLELRKSALNGFSQFTYHVIQITDGQLKNNAIDYVTKISHGLLVWGLDRLMQGQISNEMIPVLSEAFGFFKYGFKFMGKEILERSHPDFTFDFSKLLELILNEDSIYFPNHGGGCDEENEEGGFEEVLTERLNFYSEFTDTMKYFIKHISSEGFILMFGNLMPILEERMDNSDINSQIFITGLLSECMKPTSREGQGHLELCLSFFFHCALDKNEAIRQNSYFGLGEICLYVKAGDHRALEIIQPFLLEKLKNEEDPRAKDNIVSALARLVITHHKANVDPKVIPEIFKNLPLTCDLMEYDTIFLYFLRIYHSQETSADYLKKIIRNAGYVLAKKFKLAFAGTGVDSEKLIARVEHVARNIISDHKYILGEAFENMGSAEVDEILKLLT